MEARCALLAHRFDLAILDIALGAESGLELLADLSNQAGDPIPVIVFSACAADLEADLEVDASLNKSRASLEDLVATVKDRLMPTCWRAQLETG